MCCAKYRSLANDNFVILIIQVTSVSLIPKRFMMSEFTNGLSLRTLTLIINFVFISNFVSPSGSKFIKLFM